MSYRAPSCPQNWRGRRRDTENHKSQGIQKITSHKPTAETHKQKLPQEPTLGKLCLDFNKKSIRHTKRQKAQFAKTEQTSRPESDMAGMLKLSN